jgi:hypothetical protein
MSVRQIGAVAEAALSVGRITLNFHPDRITAEGVTVARGLLSTGRYRTQWETGVSSGSRSAVEGGDRDRWERMLFEGAYDAIDATPGNRPVYGALDLSRDPHGGSPRFGSTFVVLEPHVIERATFCVGDSHQAPGDIGTATEFDSILAGLFELAAAGNALDRGLGVRDLFSILDGAAPTNVPARVLDGYIEAQVHGGVDLGRDVAEIVVDPSFRDTVVEHDLAQVAQQYGVRLSWHGGSEMAIEEVGTDFRGASMPGLAARVAAADRIFDAAAIGRAAAAIEPDPPTPEGDPALGELQQLKYLWHTLLTYGHDADPGRRRPARP